MPTKETTIIPTDLHDPKWLNTFELFSWWASLDGRLFVIAQRWRNSKGQLVYLELLERDNELIKILKYEEFYAQFKAGRLSRTSNSPNDTQPRLGAAGVDLWPER